MALNDRAMSAPSKKVGNHPYNCHMAVLQWACIELGQSQSAAMDTVEQITQAGCPHCKGQNNLKASLQDDYYGQVFCSSAVPLNNMSARVGDVVVIPNRARPTHSMVIVSNVQGELLVRGYNNEGTFVGAPRDAYDTTSRNLAGRKLPAMNSVFLIPEAVFVAKVRKVTQMFALNAFPRSIV